jgi:hypothetical protein
VPVAAVWNKNSAPHFPVLEVITFSDLIPADTPYEERSIASPPGHHRPHEIQRSESERKTGFTPQDRRRSIVEWKHGPVRGSLRGDS